MTTLEELKAHREKSIEATAGGPPARTSNVFFGVGPITDLVQDEVDGRRTRIDFEHWLEANYRKLDDRGNDLGPFTISEIGRSMHRGYPADKILIDMMRAIHTYFGYPKKNCMAVGLGGGHSGFTVALMHLMNTHDPAQRTFIDTPRPESDAASGGGFFRQSWGAQAIELVRHAKGGDEDRLVFAEREGEIPSADRLEELCVKLFMGVGHETTGATCYTAEDISGLLEWIDRDPQNHHAVIDSTSLLGAMPWPKDIVTQLMEKCCTFMPFQKAIGGVSGYWVISLTPAARALLDANAQEPSWAIPRQLKLTVPENAGAPLSSNKTSALGPIYDADADKMLGGIINTYSALAFAETTYGVLRSARLVGSVDELNARSIANRSAIEEWIGKQDLLELGVQDVDRRGAAVTLLKVNDPDIGNAELHARIIARSKQLLQYEGLTHPDGTYEPGLDVARYVNAFPGTPGDYRAWIGGIRPTVDVIALLENLAYAYHRAKIVVLEEEMAKHGATVEQAAPKANGDARHDDPDRAYKVLIADLVGLRFGEDGEPDPSEVAAHIEACGGKFHRTDQSEAGALEPGTVHFFYQPHLSRAEEIIPVTEEGQYDALIAAATFMPAEARFAEGGVRIGAGTGNMACACWGGGDGAGGEAPLMNTPSFNSRATAHMTLKALLKVMPDLPVEELHARVIDGSFDTGKHLRDFPTEKLEGKKIAVIGFGNIGREVARLAKAFGMKVSVHARERHWDWIESEGFTYAESVQVAAAGADVISPHTGLGARNEAGAFANAGLIDDAVLGAMNHGAVVINYDRGEVIDAGALDRALESGQVRYAGIDADLFVDASDGGLSGPMVPYREIEARHRGKMELLPHAAADTEHVSRVEGAKQAVDQILGCIRHRRVVNLKGALPDGYSDGGAQTVNGVGRVTPQRLAGVAADAEAAKFLRALAEEMSAIWGALHATHDADRRAELLASYGADLVAASNRYTAMMDELGLQGPYAGN